MAMEWYGCVMSDRENGERAVYRMISKMMTTGEDRVFSE